MAAPKTLLAGAPGKLNPDATAGKGGRRKKGTGASVGPGRFWLQGLPSWS